MEIHKEIISFLKENAYLIEDNNFTMLYRKVPYKLIDDKGLMSTYLTEFFNKLGINPLNYMTEVPESYMEFSNKIEDLKIPEGIENINESAFHSCKNLRTVYFPSTLKRIREYAFDDCRYLSNVYYNGTMEDWNSLYIYIHNDGLFSPTVIHCIDGEFGGK